MTSSRGTDFVAVYLDTFPHVVEVCTDRNLVHPMQDWIEMHVGNRYREWQYPKDGVYMFKSKEHAVAFSLAWSGR
jgi:hypothetical protein